MVGGDQNIHMHCNKKMQGVTIKLGSATAWYFHCGSLQKLELQHETEFNFKFLPLEILVPDHDDVCYGQVRARITC
jgi:hypothetical protein